MLWSLCQKARHGLQLYVHKEGDWVQRRQPLLTKRSSHVAHPGLPGRHLVPALGVLAWKSRSGARNVRDEFEKESVSVDNSSLLRAMYDDLLAQVSQRDSAEDPSVYSAFTLSTTLDNVDATLMSPSLLAEAARQYSAMPQQVSLLINQGRSHRLFQCRDHPRVPT